jgi:hypothetical protein
MERTSNAARGSASSHDAVVGQREGPMQITKLIVPISFCVSKVRKYF